MASLGPTPIPFFSLEPCPRIAVQGSEPQLSGVWNPRGFSQLFKTRPLARPPNPAPPAPPRACYLHILPSIHDPSNFAFYFRLHLKCLIIFRLKSSNLPPRDIVQAPKVIKVKKPHASSTLLLPLWSHLPAAHITPRVRFFSPDSPAETRGALCSALGCAGQN